MKRSEENSKTLKSFHKNRSESEGQKNEKHGKYEKVQSEIKFLSKDRIT